MDTHTDVFSKSHQDSVTSPKAMLAVALAASLVAACLTSREAWSAPYQEQRVPKLEKQAPCAKQPDYCTNIKDKANQVPPGKLPSRKESIGK